MKHHRRRMEWNVKWCLSTPPRSTPERARHTKCDRGRRFTLRLQQKEREAVKPGTQQAPATTPAHSAQPAKEKPSSRWSAIEWFTKSLFMLPILVLGLRAAQDPIHSLVPPFIRTDVGEIGNWSLVGAAVARKAKVFLTPELSFVSGGVCSRVPTLSKDWVSEVWLRSRGERVLFLFTRTVCPQHEATFLSGFNVSFVNDLATNRTLIKIQGEEIFGAQTCELIEDSEEWRIRIEKKGTNVTVSSLDRPCFSQKVGGAEFGYISIWADSGNCNECVTEIRSINHFSLSPEVNHVESDIGDKNRKKINQDKEKRSMLKMKRRAQMMTVAKYISDQRKHEDVLGGEITDFRDAFREANELISRAQGCISVTNLSAFITRKVMPVIDKAAARFERVSDSLWHMRSEITSLWDGLRQDLKGLSDELKVSQMQVEQDAIYTLQKHKIIQGTPPTTPAPTSTIPVVLLVIALLEVLLFLPLFRRVVRRLVRPWRFPLHAFTHRD